MTDHFENLEKEGDDEALEAGADEDPICLWELVVDVGPWAAKYWRGSILGLCCIANEGWPIGSKSVDMS
jgi:hypothetical protein